MLSAEIQRTILDLIEKNDPCQSAELIGLYDEYAMTVRRDLVYSGYKGLLRQGILGMWVIADAAKSLIPIQGA